MGTYSGSVQRWSWVLIGVALASALATAGCGSDSGADQSNAPIGIETNQLGVTVENRTGGPPTDVTVSVRVSGLPYTRQVPRIENAQQLTVPIDDFTGPDGTHLNLRVHHPTTVGVTATDLIGNNYDVQTNWR